MGNPKTILYKTQMIRQNSLKAWVLAARPKTLTAAASPVAVGAAYTISQYGKQAYADYTPIILCFAFALIMQINANFINDYYDFLRGSDRTDRLGPERACAQGWVTEKAMRVAILMTSACSCLVGLPLVFYGGWWLIIIGAICVAGAYLYTTRLSYKGWGDVMVLMCFGIIPVVFTAYCMMQRFDGWMFLLGLAMGLVTDDLLMVNNYRDREQDALSGKRTLAVRLTPRASVQLYWYLGSFGAVIAYIILWYLNDRYCLLIIIYLLIHFFTFKKMRHLDGKALNAILAKTARNIFIFAIVVCVALLL